jgi:hypothetical protein
VKDILLGTDMNHPRRKSYKEGSILSLFNQEKVKIKKLGSLLSKLKPGIDLFQLFPEPIHNLHSST